MNHELQQLRKKWVEAKKYGNQTLMKIIEAQGKELAAHVKLCGKCHKNPRINVYLCGPCEQKEHGNWQIKAQEKLI